MIAKFIGKEKFGFKKEHEYEMELTEVKHRGYSVLTSHDNTTDEDVTLFCAYSSMNSVRTDWSLNENRNEDN